MINRKIMASLLVGAFLLPACASVPDGQKEDSHKQKTASKNVADILASMGDTVSVGATIGAGRQIFLSYSNQLDKAQKIRKGFNLGVIGTGLYTAIAAGTGAHLHNIVISTAIGNALPLIEPNVQPEGSPETLGGAMVKTNCVIRAASLTQGSDNLKAITYLEELIKRREANDEVIIAFNVYDGLKSVIISAYMQVYVDQANSATPAPLASDKVVTMLGIKTSEETAAEDANGSGSDAKTNKDNSNPSSNFGLLSTPAAAQKKKTSDYIERVTTTAALVSKAVNKCVGS